MWSSTYRWYGKQPSITCIYQDLIIWHIGPEPVLVEDLSIVDKAKDRCKVSQTDGMVIL